jgi:hypothetical protein
MIFDNVDAPAKGGFERRSIEQNPQCSESRKRNAARPHTIERKAPCPRIAVGSANVGGGAGTVVQLGRAIYYGACSHAKHQFSRRSRHDAAGMGAGEPLAHQVSPRRLLGSGACGLLEILFKQQICYWTGVLRTGRQLANVCLMTGYNLGCSRLRSK